MGKVSYTSCWMPYDDISSIQHAASLVSVLLDAARCRYDHPKIGAIQADILSAMEKIDDLLEELYDPDLEREVNGGGEDEDV